jgi:hypothetical protein
MLVAPVLIQIRRYIMAEAIKISRDDFECYLDVQNYGAWNMFSNEALTATGLPKETYFAIMKNYDELDRKYHDSREADRWVLTYTD